MSLKVFLQFLIFLFAFHFSANALPDAEDNLGRFQMQILGHGNIAYEHVEKPAVGTGHAVEIDGRKYRKTWVDSQSPSQNIGGAQRVLFHQSASPSMNLEVVEDGRCRLMPETFPQEERILMRETPGQDGRERITNTNTWPYSIHGHLLMEFANGNRYMGSGTLIGPNHVLTAGHNIYSHHYGEGWPTSVSFIPARDENNSPYGQIPAIVILSVDGWINNRSPEHDLGVVILEEDIGHTAGWAGLYTMPPALLKDHRITVTGYPGDKGDPGNKGSQMWSMDGLLRRVSGQRLYYNVDTYPGQSGSGVWCRVEGSDSGEENGCYVMGIHAYGESTHGEGNSATRLTGRKFCMLHTLLGLRIRREENSAGTRHLSDLVINPTWKNKHFESLIIYHSDPDTEQAPPNWLLNPFQSRS